MSYLVLARKYRPTTFAQLVGQDHIVRTLRNAISLGRVHHAFLFTGARGVGKTTTARLLARALNCEKGASITPCGTCGACIELLGHGAADVLEIDGASNTGVDSVRELREAVRYLPAKMRHKLYIIDEVHMLSQAAFNALLKTLEEPPPHVKFIFATTEPHKIPITILSRCQRFDFRRVGMPQLTGHLRDILTQENIAFGPEALNQIARQADGSVRDALSLLDQVLSYAGDTPSDEMVLEALGAIDRKTIAALCDAVLARDAAGLLGIVGDIETRGHDLAEAAALFSEHLRDVAVAKHVGDAQTVLPERSSGEVDALKAQADKRSHSDWQRLFSQAVGIAEDTHRSAQPKVSLEMGLLRLLDVAPTADLQTLLTRVDTLLAVASGGGALPGASGAQNVLPAQTQPTLEAAVPRPKPVMDVPAQAPKDRPDAGAAPSAASAPASAAQVQPMCLQDSPVDLPTQAGIAEPPEGPVDESAAQVEADTYAGAPKTLDKAAARTPALPKPPAQVVPTAAQVVAATQSAEGLADAAPDAAHTAWRRYVERVRSARPALASVLEHGRLLGFGPAGVQIAYPRQTFYWDAATDEANRAILLAHLTQQFDQAVPLTITALDDAADKAQPTLAEAQEQARLAAVDSVQEKARDHQAVRSAVAILGGEVKHIRVLGEGAHRSL